MSVLAPERRAARARAGASTLIGVLKCRGLHAMCLYDVWPIRTGQPRMVGIGYAMPVIPSREDKDGPASTNRATVQPQAMEEWRGGKA